MGNAHGLGLCLFQSNRWNQMLCSYTENNVASRMSPDQDDDFSKAYTTSLDRTKGKIEINIRVKSDENLEVDLLFISDLKSPAWNTEDLGLFDKVMNIGQQ